jgi:hypothetical protein
MSIKVLSKSRKNHFLSSSLVPLLKDFRMILPNKNPNRLGFIQFAQKLEKSTLTTRETMDSILKLNEDLNSFELKTIKLFQVLVITNKKLLSKKNSEDSIHSNLEVQQAVPSIKNNKSMMWDPVNIFTEKMTKKTKS